jgi:hypothetical protein
MATGKQRFLAFVTVIPIVIGIAAIGINIKKKQTRKKFEHPITGQIYTTKIGEYFNYKKIKTITKDSINFYISNYEGVKGDKLDMILEKKDAFSSQEKSYSRTELKKMLDADYNDLSIFNITDPDN